MKTKSSFMAGAVAVVVLAASPLTYAQTASSAPQNNRTDANTSQGSMGDASASTSSTSTSATTTDADKKQKEDKSATKPSTSPVTDTTAPNSRNDTSHQHTGSADQTKAAEASKNAPGD